MIDYDKLEQFLALPPCGHFFHKLRGRIRVKRPTFGSWPSQLMSLLPALNCQHPRQTGDTSKSLFDNFTLFILFQHANRYSNSTSSINPNTLKNKRKCAIFSQVNFHSPVTASLFFAQWWISTATKPHFNKSKINWIQEENWKFERFNWKICVLPVKHQKLSCEKAKAIVTSKD